ncbi:hypothetical protein BD310DRAFT_942393, partial [Dichomitus squalens]
MLGRWLYALLREMSSRRFNVGGAQRSLIAAPILLGAMRIEVSAAPSMVSPPVGIRRSRRILLGLVASQRLSGQVVCQGWTTRTVRSGCVALQG